MRYLIALLFLIVGNLSAQVVVKDYLGNIVGTCKILVQQNEFQGAPCSVTVTVPSTATQVVLSEDSNINPHARWCTLNTTMHDTAAVNCTNTNLATTFTGATVYNFRIFGERFNQSTETPGTFNRVSTVSIAGVLTNIPVQFVIVPRIAAPVFTTAIGGTQPVAGCSSGQSLANSTTPDPVYYVAGNICDTTVGRPGNPLTLPAPGGSFIDQKFGTKIFVVANHQHGYGSANFTSIDPTTGLSHFIMTEDGADYPIPTTVGIMTLPNPDGTGGGVKVDPTPHNAGLGGTISNCLFATNRERMKQFNWPEKSWLCLQQSNTPQTMELIQESSPGTLADIKTIFTLPHGPYTSICDATGRINTQGWRIIWGVYTGACGDADTDVKVHWKYLHVVDTFTGQQVEINLNDARLNWPRTLTTRSARLLDMDSNGYMYVHIYGTMNGSTDPTPSDMWLWVRPPDTAHPSGQWGLQTWGGMSNWTLGANGMNPFDCSNNNIMCKGSSHEQEYSACLGGGCTVGTAFGDTGLNTGDPQGWAFINPACGPLGLLPIEVGGCGHFGALGTHDHGGSSPIYPLMATSWETDAPNSPGGGITLNPVMRVTGISGGVLTVTDNECRTGGNPCYTTSQFAAQSVVVGCEDDDPGSIVNPRGIWTVSATTSTTITLSGYAAGAGTYSGKCAITLNSDTNNVYGLKSISVIAVDRLDSNGVPFQRALLAKPLNTGFLSGMTASEYWGGQSHPSISQDGRFAYWSAGAGYPNFLRLLVAEVPWQMRTRDEQELAPGYPVRVGGGSGTATFSLKAPSSDDYKIYFDTWVSLAQATTSCSGTVTTGCYVSVPGPDVKERRGTVTLAAGTWHWRAVSTNQKFVAQGVVTVQ